MIARDNPKFEMRVPFLITLKSDIFNRGHERFTAGELCTLNDFVLNSKTKSIFTNSIAKMVCQLWTIRILVIYMNIALGVIYLMHACDLAKEVLQVVEDSLVDTHMDGLMKRVKPVDLDLLNLIKEKGPVRGSYVTEDLKESVIRCKARGLITPQRRGDHYYKYDITDLGLSLLEQKNRVADKTEKMRV